MSSENSYITSEQRKRVQVGDLLYIRVKVLQVADASRAYPFKVAMEGCDATFWPRVDTIAGHYGKDDVCIQFENDDYVHEQRTGNSN